MVFRSAKTLDRLLDRLTDRLLRHGIDSFRSGDVLRFLGQKTPAHGARTAALRAGRHGGSTASLPARCSRTKGVCSKECGSSTGLEETPSRCIASMRCCCAICCGGQTTINDAKELKSYRRTPADPAAPPQWRPLRKSVADLSRRAQLSHSANGRYLDALAQVQDKTPLATFTDKLCQPTELNGRRVRGLRPFAAEGHQLLEAVSSGDYLTTGFRNQDIRRVLFGGDPDDPAERRRQASRTSYRLRLLRAHGLIKKIPHSHRYVLTKTGRSAITALLATRAATIESLQNAA